jgi:hypothetical protein
MTLLQCLACGDAVKLDLARRVCRCGRSAGAAVPDGARFIGPARVVRFHGEGGADPFRSSAGRWEKIDENGGATRVPVAPLL